jgi:catechol 2,3-dioxygenase-like lactoylglutathione lyase family enzyme
MGGGGVQYMVIETFIADPGAIYERARERGRMLPEGLEYVDSWVDESLGRCFQLMETDNPSSFDRWRREWDDLARFEVVPVLSSAEASKRASAGSGDERGIDVESVDFVSVATRDLERSRRFYGHTLGLEPSAHTDDEFETRNVTLGLWEPEKDGEPFVANEAGIALRVPDVHASRARLEGAGVEFIGETVDTGVCHMAFLRDPDGNVLILHRRYAPRGSFAGAEPPNA